MNEWWAVLKNDMVPNWEPDHDWEDIDAQTVPGKGIAVRLRDRKSKIEASGIIEDEKVAMGLIGDSGDWEIVDAQTVPQGVYVKLRDYDTDYMTEGVISVSWSDERDYDTDYMR